MKQLTMAFSARELDELADAYTEVQVRRKPRPNDPGLRNDVDLLIRLHGASAAQGKWGDTWLLDVPWVVPVIRKALKDAGALILAQSRIKRLELQLKEAKKPAPKPKPRFPKRKAQPVKPGVLKRPHPFPAAMPPEIVADAIAEAEKAASS